MIAVLLAPSFLDRAVALYSGRGLTNCFPVASQPSVTAILLRDNPGPDKTLRGLTKMALVAQDRL